MPTQLTPLPRDVPIVVELSSAALVIAFTVITFVGLMHAAPAHAGAPPTAPTESSAR